MATKTKRKPAGTLSRLAATAAHAAQAIGGTLIGVVTNAAGKVTHIQVRKKSKAKSKAVAPAPRRKNPTKRVVRAKVTPRKTRTAKKKRPAGRPTRTTRRR